MANFNKAPYYDDFDENKKFLQILFQPGRPVQARELTQLQAILQNQVSRGADHIFTQGSKVFDAEVSGAQQGYDSSSLRYIKLSPNDKDGNLIDVSNFIGKKIRKVDVTEGAETATVVSATAAVGGDPDTLFVRWDGVVPENIQEDMLLRTYDPTGAVTSFYTTNVSSTSSPRMGSCSVYETNAGIYYVNGRYIKTDAQSVILGKYNANVTYRIGFDVIEDIVTSSSDSSLLDPSSGFSNYTGSGADRFKVDLVLTKKGDGNTISQIEATSDISTSIGDIVASNTFFEIARIMDGLIVRQVKTPLYSELENTLARNRYDQSGNFTVSDHLYRIKEANPAGDSGLTESDSFLFGVDGGKSYVQGFEYDNTGQLTWNKIPKARTTERLPDQKVPIFYSNYILVHDVQNNTSGGVNTAILPAKGYFNGLLQERVSLFSQDNYIVDSNLGANTPGDALAANLYNSILVGTARAESLMYDSSATKSANNQGYQGRSYRLYLRDFQPNFIEGSSNGINRIDVTDQYHDGYRTTYYHLNPPAHSIHGFTNSSATSVDIFTSGADHVSITGYDADGHWNIKNGVVVASNTDWIGVQSIDQNSLNNASAPAPVGNTGILTRTTRNGLSPRRLLVLDNNSRALWSDSYNGATITLTAGPGAGDVRRVVDYIGGSTSNNIHEFQGAGDTSFLPTTDLSGISKRGLLLVDREFSAVPTRDTQYRINFGMKDARSVGVNANVTSNGFSTSDTRHLNAMDYLFNSSTIINDSVEASPNLTALWNIDAVDGISPKGSLGAFNSGDGIYRGTRVEGSTMFKSGGVLLGATARLGVKTLQPEVTYSNTHFTSHRSFSQTLTPGTSHSGETMGGTLYNHGQRWFPYDNGGGNKTLSADEANRFVHVVDRTSGLVVDFSDAGGAVVIEEGSTGSNHLLRITVPNTGAYSDGGAGVYDITATVLHENVAPKAKTLVRANTQIAPDLATVGYHLSNGQIKIIAAGGNSALTAIRPFDTDSPVTLGISDVFSVKVIDTMSLTVAPTDDMVGSIANGNTTIFNTTGANNITERFVLDTGQRDRIYDHGSLTLKSEAQKPNGQCLVLVDYFSHPVSLVDSGEAATAPKYFSVDSYQHTEDIAITGEIGSGAAFAAGDIITGNVSGVSGKILDVVADGNTLKVVNLNRNGGTNSHFLTVDSIHRTNIELKTSTREAEVTSVANLQISYENIPEYKGSSRTYSLRDVVDYRPRRLDGDVWNAAPTVENVVIPLDCTAIDLNEHPRVIPKYTFDAYVGRIDKIYVTKSREVVRKAGTPASIPVPPRVIADDGMALFEVMLPPYTFAASHVLVRPITHRRYTMKDIGRIDDRVKNLEYYIALSSLERAAKDENVVDSQGLNRFKNGFLTDNFNAFNTVRRKIGETIDLVDEIKVPNYALDTTDGQLRPATTVNSTAWAFQYSDITNTTVSGSDNDVVTLDYTSEPWIDAHAPFQLMATESKERNPDGSGELVPDGEGSGKVNVNPFSMFNYNGFMRLTPNFDNFIDTVDTGEIRFVNLTGLDNPLEGLGADVVETAATGSGTTHVTNNPNDPITTQEQHGAYITNSGAPDHIIEESSDMTTNHTDLNGSGWGDTKDHYHTSMVQPQEFSIELGETFYRSFATIDNIPQITLTKTENSIVNVSIATYMRPKNITISATGMKPHTSLHGHFDGVNVDPYISAASMVRLSGEGKCLLGSRTETGRTGQFVQEWVNINSGAGRAKLVAVRGNTAFLTEISYTGQGAAPNFAEDGITITGETTGRTAVTAQQDKGIPQGMTQNDEGDWVQAQPNPNHDHRSGYVRDLAVETDTEEWIRLAPDAPSVSNSLCITNQDLESYGTEAEALGIHGLIETSIKITRGSHAGAVGRIVEYDGANREARVSWTGPAVNVFVTDTKLVGTQGAEDRDYYTLGSPFASGVDSLYTSSQGEFYGTFNLPKNDVTKFTTGSKTLTINDRGDNNPFLITTWASAPYFSSGSVHEQVDEVIATRDVVQGPMNSGIEYGIQSAADGSNFLAGTRADGERGVVWVTTGIEVLRQGDTNPSAAGSTYIQAHGGAAKHGWDKWLRGTFVGAVYNEETGQYDYTPTPTTDKDGASVTTWAEIYNNQIAGSGQGEIPTAELANISVNKPGQKHSIERGSDDTSGRGWRFHYQNYRFPSIVPFGGDIGGSKAFATVEDGLIVDATMTDHGACVMTEGRTPSPPMWYALYPSNAPPGRKWGGNQKAFLGKSIVSSDPADIRASLPYVDNILTQIENGTGVATGYQNITDQDPLAQSFAVPPAAAHGVFLTGVDLWFADKGTQDVTVEMRRLINGYPDQTPMPCVGGSDPAVAVVQANDIEVRNGVSTSIEGGTGYPDATDDSVTTFTFPAPVYLYPGIDYCFVVQCETSKEFFLWTSDLRGNILGSDAAGDPRSVDIAKAGQHFGGSLFLSQNAKTWEPDQYKDMMFRLRIANFTASAGVAKFNAGTTRFVPTYDSQTGTLRAEQVEAPLTSNLEFDFFHFAVEDRLPLGHNNQAGEITYTYSSMDPSDGVASAAKSFVPNSTVYLDNPLQLEKNQTGADGSFEVKATLTSAGGGTIGDYRVSPIIDRSTMELIALQNRISDGRIRDENIKFAGPEGGSFVQGNTFKLVPADLDDHANSDIGYIQVAEVTASGGAILSLNVSPTTPGKNYSETPTLEDGDVDGTFTDRPLNEVIRIAGETGTIGGNSKFRYVTKPVKLKGGMDALDLTVMMDVHRPLGARVYVYYKIMHRDDPGKFDEKKWVKMKQESPGNDRFSLSKNSWSSKAPLSMMEHNFTTGSNDVLTYGDSNGHTFDGFKYFAIKIVGFADNSAQVPVIGNLRAIAVT